MTYETNWRKHNLVLLFDNNFLDFLYVRHIDPKIFDEIGTTLHLVENDTELIAITAEVYKKMINRYPHPYGERFASLNTNWENIVGAVYASSEEFKQDYADMKIFLRRAVSCLGAHIDSEDMDLFASASLLKQKQLNPIIVSNDSRFIYFSDIISSYFGFYLRAFSAFELLTYLRPKTSQTELSTCLNHFDVGMSLKCLCEKTEIADCDDFQNDVTVGARKGVFSAHYSSENFPQLIRH